MKQNSGIRLIGRCGALALAAVLSCGAFAACKKQPNAEQMGRPTPLTSTKKSLRTQALRLHSPILSRSQRLAGIRSHMKQPIPCCWG